VYVNSDCEKMHGDYRIKYIFEVLTLMVFCKSFLVCLSFEAKDSFSDVMQNYYVVLDWIIRISIPLKGKRLFSSPKRPDRD
jgi:hypothetical protein